MAELSKNKKYLKLNDVRVFYDKETGVIKLTSSDEDFTEGFSMTLNVGTKAETQLRELLKEHNIVLEEEIPNKYDPLPPRHGLIPIGRNSNRELFFDTKDNDKPRVLSCFGGTGSGKTMFIKKFISNYKLMYPDSEINVLTEVILEYLKAEGCLVSEHGSFHTVKKNLFESPAKNKLLVIDSLSSFIFDLRRQNNHEANEERGFDININDLIETLALSRSLNCTVVVTSQSARLFDVNVPSINKLEEYLLDQATLVHIGSATRDELSRIFKNITLPVSTENINSRGRGIALVKPQDEKKIMMVRTPLPKLDER